ncbi:hypothetical protein A0H81_00283 [Grifola frondosa]|uniref:Uncharacterized protein n=1 Tax=Grifola frondosa TaxID=5627 RepID=A0A1C7MQH1_GRIFR|nr:hypothetical protein A0H81_00283 [Grifola frondosa]
MDSAAGDPGVFQLAENLMQNLRNMSTDDLSSLKALIPIINGIINERNSVSKIPSEILCHIFRYVPSAYDYASHIAYKSNPSYITEYPPFMWPDNGLRSTRELIPITRVCRRWREIALGSPLLWSSISDPSDSAALTYLERAGGSVPLTVYLGRISTQFCRNVFDSHILRLRELHVMLWYTPGLRSSSFPRYFNSPAPELENLTISIDPNSANRPPNVEFPILFDGNIPRLKVLNLHFQTWLPGNHFPNLTHLFLFVPSIATEYEPTAILTLLSKCPMLQDMVVVNVAPPSDWDYGLRYRSAPLHHLRRVAMGRMPMLLVAWLLSQIILPTEGLALRAFETRSVGISDMTHLPSADAFRRFTRLHLIMRTLNTFQLVATGSDCGFHADTKVYDNTGPLSLDEFELLAQHSILPVDRIKELWVTIEPLQTEAFVTLLNAFPALTVLVLNIPRSDIDLLVALALITDSEGTPVPPLCPYLSTLHLYLNEAMPVPHSLGAIAAGRAQHGHRIQHLIVESVPESIAQLEADLEWAHLGIVWMWSRSGLLESHLRWKYRRSAPPNFTSTGRHGRLIFWTFC